MKCFLLFLNPQNPIKIHLQKTRLVGGFFTNPSEKYATVKLGSSSPNWDENEKKDVSCHQLDFQATNKPALNEGKWLFPTISYVEIW